MCNKSEVEEKVNGYNKIILDFLNLHLRRSIIKYNTQQPRKIQSAAVSAAGCY